MLAPSLTTYTFGCRVCPKRFECSVGSTEDISEELELAKEQGIPNEVRTASRFSVDEGNCEEAQAARLYGWRLVKECGLEVGDLRDLIEDRDIETTDAKR